MLSSFFAVTDVNGAATISCDSNCVPGTSIDSVFERERVIHQPDRTLPPSRVASLTLPVLFC
jgi:hypothetical protein